VAGAARPHAQSRSQDLETGIVLAAIDVDEVELGVFGSAYDLYIYVDAASMQVRGLFKIAMKSLLLIIPKQYIFPLIFLQDWPVLCKVSGNLSERVF